MGRKFKPAIERFMGLTSPEPNSGCWLWAGTLTKKGYGCITVGVPGEWRRARANRVAYELFNGAIPEGAVVRHACDVPACVNPGHLLLGSPKDNTADMHARGRAADRRGDNNPRRKISAADAAEITSRGTSAAEYAERFGISQRHVYDIWNGKSWAGTNASG